MKHRTDLVASVTVFAIVVGCGGTVSLGKNDRKPEPGEGGISAGGGGTSARGGATSAGGAAASNGAGGTGAVPSTFVGTGATSACPLDAGCAPGHINVPSGSSLCGGVQCTSSEECCLLTAKCVSKTDPAACPKPAVSGAQAPGCAKNSDCAETEFCANATAVGQPSANCAGPGQCVSRTNCGGTGDEGFCGCDGKTYPNLQSTCAAGVRYSSWAACGEPATLGAGDSPGSGLAVIPCGVDAQCPSGSHCCGITGTCFDAAHASLCVPPPDGATRACLTTSDCMVGAEYCSGPGCTGLGGCVPFDPSSCGPVLDPTCGCDGKTYVNAGCAAAAATRVASAGNCP